MGEGARIILRKVYLWRATLWGLLFGFIISTLFITVSLGGLWFLSEARGITPPGITREDLVFFGAISIGLFTFLSAFSVFVLAIFYNLITKLGGGLHMNFEENTPLSIGVIQ